MNWNELAEKISTMTEEERMKTVSFVTYEKCSFGARFVGDYFEIDDIEYDSGDPALTSRY